MHNWNSIVLVDQAWGRLKLTAFLHVLEHYRKFVVMIYPSSMFRVCLCPAFSAGAVLYNLLSKYILNEEQLVDNGFPRKDTTTGHAKIKRKEYNKKHKTNDRKWYTSSSKSIHLTSPKNSEVGRRFLWIIGLENRGLSCIIFYLWCCACGWFQLTRGYARGVPRDSLFSRTDSIREGRTVLTTGGSAGSQ